ncbi:MAG: glycosyltransferase [Planctomycetes bacterium]|nr:glycosyltransferase [Planctomycetota bacterium]
MQDYAVGISLLEHCVYRIEALSGDFFCTHSRVVARDSLVNASICSLCCMREVPCIAPREFPPNVSLASAAAEKRPVPSTIRNGAADQSHGHANQTDAARVSFCLSLRNRANNFINALTLLDEAADTICEVVIADFGSDDLDLANVLKATRLPSKIVAVPMPFNRSRGLNAAAAVASGEILFFLDADILVPKDICASVRRHAQPGRAYFPICYSLRQGSSPNQSAPGWWRTEGFGLCGFHRTDFEKLRWDESFTTWGGEDNDLFRRAAKALKIERSRCPGLFHLWHPDGRGFMGRYHIAGSSESVTRQALPPQAISSAPVHGHVNGKRITAGSTAHQQRASSAPSLLSSPATGACARPSLNGCTVATEDRQPKQPLADMPRVGFLVPSLPMGGVGQVIADTVAAATRVQFSGIALRSPQPVFSTYEEIFRGRCPVLQGTWQSVAQHVIDESDAVIIWGFAESSVYAGLSFHGRPVIAQAHNTKLEGWTARTIQAARPVATHFTACSDAAVHSYPPDLRSKVHVIHNGCSPSRLVPRVSRAAMRQLWGIDEATIVVAYAGRIVAEKRPELAAVAVRELGSNYLAAIIGEGNHYDCCRRQATAAAPGQVEFLPAVTNIADVLGAIDVWFNASRYEGSCMALIEALLFGVPVVTTVTGAVPEFEQAAGRQLVAHLSDEPTADELANRIREALHEATRERTTFAREWALANITSTQMAREFEEVILAVCGCRR